MDENSIDRIRSASFTIARRGYDTREVERFLGKLADWLETGGEDEARADLVRRELERVGQRTANILATAGESAEELRAEAKQEAEATLAGAIEEANQMVAAAEAKAGRIVGEGLARRRDIETVIGDLVDRRDTLVAEVSRLATELRSVVATLAPADGSDPFDPPSELDPEERVKA